jgi:5-formyltetrahydrofolate cyclo-ligase
MTDGVDNQKRALRAEIRERRRVLPDREYFAATAAVTEHLKALAEGSTSIAAYLSTPEEPGTRAFLRWASERGIRVLVPFSREDGLLDWAPFDDKEESEDAFGMPVPTTELLGPIAINDVDLIFVPAACVDHSGMRMGWGRGYFDKTLGSMDRRPPVYAVIFDSEFLESVPSERHDERVDGVVTPSGITKLPLSS